jgi:hypothetical protein
MTKLRGEERWVKACIEAALWGVEARQHDDNSRGGMHDLDLIRDGDRFGAVEVTAAADAESIELWKLVNQSGERWIEPSLSGGWTVCLLPAARAKQLRNRLPLLLGELERRGIKEIGRRHRTDRFDAVLSELGIVTAHQGGTDFPGSIYLMIELPHERSGGFIGDTGDPLAAWLSGWLLERDQADNLAKLQRSGARERHLFLILPGFTTAPFTAAELLMRSNETPLPTIPPELPSAVTHVWAMSTWETRHGLRWSPDHGWSTFAKVLVVETPPGD